jgi:hypothetical protein
MRNARQLGLIMLLALAGGLVPLADVDACRRCRRDRACAPQCESTLVHAQRSEIGVFSVTSKPSITGYLYDAISPTGALYTTQYTINVFSTVDGTASTTAGNLTPIGNKSDNAGITGKYTVDCYGDTKNNNMIVIQFQRGPMPMLGAPVTITVSLSQTPKVNPSLP